MSASRQGSWDASAPGSGLIPLAPVPATDVAAMTADQIMPLLHGLQPGAVTDAGQAHLRLGQNLAATADKLAAHGQTLSENWTGQSSDTALAKLEQVHAQTLTLAQAATQAGDVLTWLGQTVLPSFKELPDPRGGLLNAGGSLITGLEHAADYLTGNTSAAAAGSAADATARNYLTTLNGYLVEASNNLPTAMGTAAVTSASAIGTAGGRAGTAGGGPGTAVGFPPGTGPGAGVAGGVRSPAGRLAAVAPAGNAGGGRPSPGAPSAGTGSGLSSPPGSLQSAATPPASPSSAMPGAPSGAGGIGSAAGEAAGSVPGAASVAALGIPGVSPDGSPDGGAGLPGASAGDDVPDVPGFGAGANGYGAGANGYGADTYGPGGPPSAGVAGAQDGLYGTSAADGGGMAAAGADGATGADMAGFPLMGAGSGSQQDRERQRQAWTYEDEDIWGGPTDCVPAVIEGTDWIWKKNQGR